MSLRDLITGFSDKLKDELNKPRASLINNQTLQRVASVTPDPVKNIGDFIRGTNNPVDSANALRQSANNIQNPILKGVAQTAMYPATQGAKILKGFRDVGANLPGMFTNLGNNQEFDKYAGKALEGVGGATSGVFNLTPVGYKSNLLFSAAPGLLDKKQNPISGAIDAFANEKTPTQVLAPKFAEKNPGAAMAIDAVVDILGDKVADKVVKDGKLLYKASKINLNSFVVVDPKRPGWKVRIKELIPYAMGELTGGKVDPEVAAVRNFLVKNPEYVIANKMRKAGGGFINLGADVGSATKDTENIPTPKQGGEVSEPLRQADPSLLKLPAGRPQLPTGEPIGVKPHPSISRTQLKTRTAIPNPMIKENSTQPITDAERVLSELGNGQKALPSGKLQLPAGEPISTTVDWSKVQKPISQQGELMKQSPKTAYSLWQQAEDRIKASSIFDNNYVKELTQKAKVIKENPVAKQADVEKVVESILPKQTPVGKKVGLLDYLRTPDKVLEKIGLGKQAKDLRNAHSKYLQELPVEIDKITSWYKQASDPQSATLIFKRLDGQNVNLNPTQEKLAGEIKTYLQGWADKLKLPADKRISNYITHIFDDQIIKKEFDDDLAKIIQDKVAGSVYDPFVQQRLGVQGYKENVWEALDAYVKRAVRKYNLDPALEQVKGASDKLELSQFNYVKNYIDRVNMRPTETDNLLDNTIKQVVGYKFGQRPVANLTRAGRQMLYRGTLGLNVGSAVRNLTQGVNTYAKLGEKYTLIGYTKLLTKGTKELPAEVFSNNMIEDRALSATKKFWQTADKGLFAFFEAAEKINRGSAFYGAKSKGLASGMTEEKATEYALKIVRDTQFAFGKIDTPVALQSDMVKLLTQFQSYNVKQIEFLGEMVKGKDLAGLTRYAVGSVVILSTLGKLLGMDWKSMIPSVKIGSNDGGMIPPAMNPAFQAGKIAITGKDKYGNDLTTEQRIKGAASELIPYVPAGVQIKKTIGGLGDVARGYAQTQGGNVKYPVKQDVGNTVRGALFGGYTLPEAQQFRKDGSSALSAKQSEVFKQSGNDTNLYKQIMAKRTENKDVAKVKDQVKKDGKTQTTDSSIYYYDGENVKEVKRNITVPTLTGNNELNKKLLSEYKSSLGDYVDYAVYMYKNGKMTEQQAGAILDMVKAKNKAITTATSTKSGTKTKLPDLSKIVEQNMKPVKVQSTSAPRLKTAEILDNFAKLKSQAPKIVAPNFKKGKKK